ncbi:MAG: rhomboid family intramembrane serine protease [Planctomycetota bacterium]
MGIADRQYDRNKRSFSGGMGGGFGGGGVPTGGGLNRLKFLSVTTWLILINCAIFFVQAVAGSGFANFLYTYGHFSTDTLIFRVEFWRLLTFQFLHANLMHLVFNMIGLIVFGPMVEGFLGRRRYLAFYLLCGICGGLLYLVLNLVGAAGVNLPGALAVSTSTPLIGASAGVFGVILACARIEPNRKIMLLFPPVPLKLSWLAFGYVFIALLNLLTGGSNAGGDAAHIGGAAAGFFFITRAHLLTDFFDVLNDSRKKAAAIPEAQRQRKRAAAESEIDRILVKVQNNGLQSLTDKERDALRKASEDKRSAG